MSKNYSEKVKQLLERFDSHSLKILLEEDEDSNSDNDSNDQENTKSDETDSEKESGDDLDFEFPSGEDSDDDKDNSEEEDEIEGVLDSDSESAASDQDEGPSTESLEKHLRNAIRDFQNQLSTSTNSADVVLAVDDQANSYLNKPRTSYYEDDLTKKLQVAGYQRQSIGNFIFEQKQEDKVDQKKFDDIEAQIEKLEYLTDLMDNKFNRKSNQVNENDLPDILEKSIDLINFHDPVEYAHDETIKYISVKADPKLKERLIEDFKVMFNERCKKEGYDTSSITGMSTVSPTKFKTGVTGVQS